eukprot:10895796-Ditylum_brightwellii.AAC.1
MDALRNLGEKDMGREDTVLYEDFLYSEEGGHTKRITDKTKSKHPLPGKHAGFGKGNWLGMVNTIRTIFSLPSRMLSKLKFDFNLNENSVDKNGKILGKYGYDMAQTIAENKGSTMWYRSKFRPPDDLRKSFGHHGY